MLPKLTLINLEPKTENKHRTTINNLKEKVNKIQQDLWSDKVLQKILSTLTSTLSLTTSKKVQAVTDVSGQVIDNP
ncbi:hypothetical protein P344_02670 [Spiroplasma mirum ATCC 29335]|uniref:Uncharacterized protein n=1 Tax=Spiroplasma mirum ATCC 29335 TaxID=838561 RepID=W0GQH6_9MOLU|nr:MULTISPECIES: hypothetical protein [Spiroplasma]AHF60884.1 hypothetical protein SMM_0444 [Spiroplasma mirum ATCC 29335]AHI57879.1 hypothetical protein P344_02670 [Spiroplasma mirum ATCC 29335]AKM52996.1 hypothetical protein SATRI_v1c05010 [Spiroplasma atrichopogonis]